MANTYTQIYLQLVFTPLKHENVLPVKHKEELNKYTTGIIQNRKHKLLAINYMPDHVHIFIGYNPSQSLPDLLRDIKANTAKFINEKKWMPGKFQWQKGYGAFSYSHSQIDDVIKYIIAQEEHHKRTTFREEYLKILEKFDVDYDPDYLFDWIKITVRSYGAQEIIYHVFSTNRPRLWRSGHTIYHLFFYKQTAPMALRKHELHSGDLLAATNRSHIWRSENMNRIAATCQQQRNATPVLEPRSGNLFVESI